MIARGTHFQNRWRYLPCSPTKRNTHLIPGAVLTVMSTKSKSNSTRYDMNKTQILFIHGLWRQAMHRGLQIHNKWMVNFQEDVLLLLRMYFLLPFTNVSNAHTLQSKMLPCWLESNSPYSTNRSNPYNRDVWREPSKLLVEVQPVDSWLTVMLT